MNIVLRKTIFPTDVNIRYVYRILFLLILNIAISITPVVVADTDLTDVASREGLNQNNMVLVLDNSGSMKKNDPSVWTRVDNKKLIPIASFKFEENKNNLNDLICSNLASNTPFILRNIRQFSNSKCWKWDI